MVQQLLNIKNKEFIFLGSNSSLARYSVDKLSKNNFIFGTFNKKRPENSKKFTLLKKVDLSKKTEIENFYFKIKKNLNNIILINSAAYNKDSLLVDVEERDLLKSFKVNVFANFYLCKLLLPIMIKNKWGRIIHISSSKASSGSKGSSVYGSSKSALIGLSNNIANEYGRFGITSNILSLGYFDSGLFHNLDKSLQERYLQSIPQKKLGTPQEVFNLIDAIVKSPFINGSILNIDGAAETWITMTKQILVFSQVK